MTTTPKELAQSDRSYLIAAAGYGKTEIIARAVATTPNQRDLILTHTHAGVHSLKSRLKKLNVPTKSFQVTTIASWVLRYLHAYPELSNLTPNYMPQNNDEWAICYKAIENLIRDNGAIKKVVQESFASLYVDEYQDCTISQHNIVCQLANLMPCRIVGDPLQSLFDFAGDTIDWDTHVKQEFVELPELQTPWRWQNTNPQLGNWLVELRAALINNQEIDISGLEQIGVFWHKNTGNLSIQDACKKSFPKNDSTIVIRHVAQRCHKLARSLVKWGYVSIEEMEAKDLIDWVTKFASAQNNELAVLIVDFCSQCMTGISNLKSIKNGFSQDPIKITSHQRKKYPEVVSRLESVANDNDPQLIKNAIIAISQIPETRIFRYELFQEMIRTLQNYHDDKSISLEETARKARNQTSIIGRRIRNKVISRTLLVKGLEFDHSIVADLEQFNMHNIYVGITRGSKSLTIVSKSPIIKST